MSTLRRFLADQEAATAIEYAMIASGISIVIAAVVVTIGDQIKTNLYQKIANLL
ncbi:MAG TPA: Flp family type IVb pilin [Pseudolabrys sp.]|nr:Flp family type IVb pilin [Pseudolabrys sp.]